MLKKHQNLKNFRLPCHFLVHLSLSLLRVTTLNRKAKSGQKNIEFFDRSFYLTNYLLAKITARVGA